MPSKQPNISPSAVISPAKELLSSELTNETVILDMTSGVYYGLNEVGARVWELIRQPRSFENIYHVLLSEYDVEPALCQQDLTKILLDLENSHLVEISREPNQP